MRTFCGSPSYCAPECLSKIKYDGRQSDVWSLGVLLFSLVTGEHPWNVTNAAVMLRQILKAAFTIPSHVSDPCRSLIEGMLKLVPGDRMTMQQILEHPWLKLGDTAEWRDAVARPVLEPPTPPPMTMQQIFDAAGRAQRHAEGEIVSPFEQGASAVAIRVCARSLSFDQAKLTPAGGRAKPPPTLAQARQRSVSNLRGMASPRLPPTPRRCPPLVRTS